MTKSAIGTAALWVMAAAAEACTAQSTIDVARREKGSDAYTAARDAATGFMDQEGWRKDEPSVESAVGTLLTEKTWGVEIADGGTTVSGWQAAFSAKSKRPEGGHGRTRSGASLSPAQVTVRDHMRGHVYGWQQILDGQDPDGLRAWWEQTYGGATAPAEPEAPAPPAETTRPGPVVTAPAAPTPPKEPTPPAASTPRPIPTPLPSPATVPDAAVGRAG